MLEEIHKKIKAKLTTLKINQTKKATPFSSERVINKQTLIHKDVISGSLLSGAVNCVYLYLISTGFVFWNLSTKLKRSH